jgi:hypothetical protein
MDLDELILEFEDVFPEGKAFLLERFLQFEVFLDEFFLGS